MSVESVTITDAESGASARVLVGFGFNCYEFWVPSPTGPVNHLWSVERFSGGRERASSSGIPILFPFPGRIGGTVFSWRGQDYELEAGDGQGNAIHGFVLDRPWRVVEATSSRVVGQFHSRREAPELRKKWPADFRITVSYELSGTTLRSTLRVDNPDDRPLPCGLGTHPCFRMPFSGADASDHIVRLPFSQRWELVNMRPTGRIQPVENADELSAGIPFSEIALDDVFCGLTFQDAICETSIEAPCGRRLTQTFGDAFRECVVYTPPHREAICIEPYTCVPNAHRLAESGVSTGLRILEPGESFDAWVEIRVS